MEEKWIQNSYEMLPESMLGVLNRLENMACSNINREQYESLAGEIYTWLEDACIAIEVLADATESGESIDETVDSAQQLSRITNGVVYYHNRLGVLAETVNAAEKSLMRATMSLRYSEGSPNRQLHDFFEHATQDEKMPVAIRSLWEIYVVMEVIPFASKGTEYIRQQLFEIMQRTVSSNDLAYFAQMPESQYRDVVVKFPEIAVDIAYDTLEWYDEQEYSNPSEKDEEDDTTTAE